MAHVSGTDRTQVMLTSLDLMVAQDSEARLIDEFADGLDLGELGIGATPRPKETASSAPAATEADDGQAALFEAPEPVAPAERPTTEGRPSYDPRAMLKLYIYGNRDRIRSSRRPGRACETNVEVMWLVEGVRPDFRTIARFRRENATRLKGVFRAFGRAIREAVAEAVDTAGAFESVDGSKFRACCSKMANFTAGKLDDRIAWLESHLEDYLRMLDEADAEDEASPAGYETATVRRLSAAGAMEKISSPVGRPAKMRFVGTSVPSFGMVARFDGTAGMEWDPALCQADIQPFDLLAFGPVTSLCQAVHGSGQIRKPEGLPRYDPGLEEGGGKAWLRSTAARETI